MERYEFYQIKLFEIIIFIFNKKVKKNMEQGQSIDNKRYIFHEIEIQPEHIEEESYHGIPKLSEVLDLIKMYRLLQNDSEYTKIRHLFPTLRYTVLIESMSSTIENVTSVGRNSSMMIVSRPRTVRLYFDTMPIPPEKIQNRLSHPYDAIQGLGLDIVTNVDSVQVIPQKITSSPTQGSSDFLRCFFIPYQTKHCVFCKVSLQQQQKQQKKNYQSKQSIFNVDSHESMKFFLSPQKISQQITDKHLIAAFAEHCPEKNIKKNGDPLTQKQQKQIRDLESQVDQIKRQCGHIIVKTSQIHPLLSSLSTIQSDMIPFLSNNRSIELQPVQSTSFRSDSNAIPLPSTISLLQQKRDLLRSAQRFNDDVTLITCLKDQIRKLQQVMRRHSGIGRDLVPTVSSSSYDGQVLLKEGGFNRRIQKGQGSYLGILMRELPEFSILVKMDKEIFKDNFEHDIVVLQKSPSHNYYKLASTDSFQHLEDGALYRFISLDNFESNEYEVVTNLESDDQQQLYKSSNDKILVQINIQSFFTQQQEVILSNTFPFQDKDGSSYDKIITKHGGHFVVGKYYQENLQRIFVGDNVQDVLPGNKFYKFISSNKFDPNKYSLVTDMS